MVRRWSAMFVVWMSMFFTLAVSTASASESGFDPYTVYDDNTGQAYIRNCEGAPWANHDASIHRHRLSIWGVPYSLGLGARVGEGVVCVTLCIAALHCVQRENRRARFSHTNVARFSHTTRTKGEGV